MRYVSSCLIALVLIQTSTVAQTDACTEEHTVFISGHATPDPFFEPIAGVAEACSSPAVEDITCDDVLAATDIATPVMVDSTPLQDDQAHDRQSAAYYELRLLTDAAYEDRELLTRIREVAPQLTPVQRADLFERGRKAPTAWAFLLNFWPIPMLGSIITDDWAAVGYMIVGALVTVSAGMGQKPIWPIVAIGGVIMIYAVCRPIINSVGISRFNKDLRDALGIASTAMLELAPVLVPSMASQFTPGVGLHIRF